MLAINQLGNQAINTDNKEIKANGFGLALAWNKTVNAQKLRNLVQEGRIKNIVFTINLAQRQKLFIAQGYLN